MRSRLLLAAAAVAGMALGIYPALPQAQRSASLYRDGYQVEDHHANGRLAVRLVTIEGLGHAWSGGDAKFPHFDERKPDATRLICEFFSLL